jgi:polysaccharide biosynthesis/export protein
MKYFNPLLALIFLTIPGVAQVNTSQLSKEFLDGLPASVRDEVEIKNDLETEEEIEKLFQADTSLDKNKVLLQKIKKELSTLEKKFNAAEGKKKGPDQLERFGSKFFQSIQSSFMPINIPNLTSSYIIDVGDSISITLAQGGGGPVDDVAIGRDGSVLLAGYGKIELGGLTINQAEKKITDFFRIKAPAITPYIQVSKQRDTQILVMGFVEAPGIYTLSSGSNVIGALDVAGGISDTGSYRNITLKRNGKVINIIDLYDLFVFGNFDHTLQLRSGDVLYVNPKGISIPVTGGINNPAIYEIKGSESAADVITFAGGFAAEHIGYDYLNLQRVSLDNTKIMKIAKKDLASTKIFSRDSLIIPSFATDVNSALSKVVKVVGRVKQPGTYTFEEGATLADIIRQAGGYEDNAYTYGGALFRKDAMEKEEIYAQLNYSDTVNFIISNIGRPGANVGSSALDLLAEELRAKRFEGRVIANFDLDQIERDPALNLAMVDGDVITIPSMQKIVYMFGDFRNPSNITYNPNMSLADYIKLAGGPKDSAYSQIVIIDPDGKTNIYSTSFYAVLDKNITIYPGSIIYAPRDIGKLSGVLYASTVAPILSSLAISLASLNSINN